MAVKDSLSPAPPAQRLWSLRRAPTATTNRIVLLQAGRTRAAEPRYAWIRTPEDLYSTSGTLKKMLESYNRTRFVALIGLAARTVCTRRVLFGTLKIAIPIAIIVGLVGNVDQTEMTQLRARPKHWGLLTGAFSLVMAAICCNFVRWYLLVRTLRLQFRLRDAFRLGFLGYLLNFVSFGSVGGDLFKALALAHEQPGRRTEAVASVIVDRMVGLYALLVVTTGAILSIQIPDPSQALIQIRSLTYLATVIGGLGVLMVLTPGFTRGSLSEMLASLPKIGPTLGSLISSVRMYRDKKAVMVVIFCMSLGVHVTLSTAMFMTANALFTATPSWPEHLIIVPLSMVAGAIPLTPAGLGTFEGAMEYLYGIEMSNPETTESVSGVLVALAYRLTTIAIAAIGVVYYWTSRREVQAIMEESRAEDAG